MDILPILDNLTYVKRFSITVMFLSKDEKQGMEKSKIVLNDMKYINSNERERQRKKNDIK